MIVEGKEQKQEGTQDKPNTAVQKISAPKLTASDGTLANAVIRIQEIEEALRLSGVLK